MTGGKTQFLSSGDDQYGIYLREMTRKSIKKTVSLPVGFWWIRPVSIFYYLSHTVVSTKVGILILYSSPGLLRDARLRRPLRMTCLLPLFDCAPCSAAAAQRRCRVANEGFCHTEEFPPGNCLEVQTKPGSQIQQNRMSFPVSFETSACGGPSG